LIQTGSVDEAVRAANAGVDAVIAQGVEAGAGTSVDAIHDIKPAAAIVGDLVREAEAALAKE
jgi:predicted TIM-barrel enzyme